MLSTNIDLSLKKLVAAQAVLILLDAPLLPTMIVCVVDVIVPPLHLRQL